MVWVLIEPIDGGSQETVTERSFLKWQKVKGEPELRSDGKKSWRIVSRSEQQTELKPKVVGPATPVPIKPILPEELQAVAPAPKPALPEPVVQEKEPMLDPAGQPVLPAPNIITQAPEKRKYTKRA